MIPVCEECNERANRLIDRPLIRLNVLSRERARLGLRDVRTNQPSSFSETVFTDDGLKLRANWSQEGIVARFLPVEIPIPGTNIVQSFLDERDAEEHARKQAERAEKRGLTIGPAVDRSELPELPPPLLAPGEQGLFVARPRPQEFPPWVWPAAMAKISLGCLCHAASLGLPRPTPKCADTLQALRMLAFDHLYPTDIWDADEIRSSPLVPAPTHEPTSHIDAPEHLFALREAEHQGQAPLAQLVLFGQFLMELRLPGVAVPTPFAGLFCAVSRRVAFGSLDDITRVLQGRRKAPAQPLFEMAPSQ